MLPSSRYQTGIFTTVRSSPALVSAPLCALRRPASNHAATAGGQTRRGAAVLEGDGVVPWGALRVAALEEGTLGTRAALRQRERLGRDGSRSKARQLQKARVGHARFATLPVTWYSPRTGVSLQDHTDLGWLPLLLQEEGARMRTHRVLNQSIQHWHTGSSCKRAV